MHAEQRSSRRIFGRRASSAALLLGLVFASRPSAAHGVGSSQLELRVVGARVEGKWELQLRDARLALGLAAERSGDGALDELRAHATELRAYLARGVSLRADGVTCPLSVSEAPFVWEREQNQLALAFGASCPQEPIRLEIEANLLFEREPGHRAYFSLEDARVTDVGVFTAKHRAVSLEIHQFHRWAGFVEFLREGVAHIWSGSDHLLFLIALLLPASLIRTSSGVQRAEFGRTLRETLKVVTAFTLAHSITLGLAFFGALLLPTRVVEIAISVSVFVAAWNNLRPFLPGRAWLIAFLFGLVHGLGFAGVLRNLMLPLRERGLALFAFNVGVECGQLVIVALVLPVLYLAARRREYSRWVLAGGSFAVAWVAALWILERGFGFSFFPGS